MHRHRHGLAKYDTMLRDIADRLAPEHQVRIAVSVPHAPWFDAECSATRRHCRKLERRYQRTKNDADYSAFLTASLCKHDEFVVKNHYWTGRITEESGVMARRGVVCVVVGCDLT